MASAMSSSGPIPKLAYCRERTRLIDELLAAIRAITVLLDEQTQALIDDDPDYMRFDILLHYAQVQKEEAKYAWLSHIESHGCGD